MKRAVYLAGPIAGLTEGEAKEWRSDVIEQLAEAGIVGISPLRCEPAIDGRYDVPKGMQYEDPCFGTAKAIGAKNEFDTRNCDMILAYFPYVPGRPVPSVGTIVEIGWGHAWGKSVIVVTDDDYLKHHPLIQHCASWSLDTLEQAVEVILGVMGDYAG